ncbi:helix-turn-helix domain-containing protein [Maritalea porphyrae]|jgi:transcriptional regulator with XRE-family HTH domain|uniref:helix-turn-helix domain-containing protein n=1 Tax=Maritalea porphyrae TaxID=880732 RepID=UPI0022AFD505|nr:helix-turn-helix domain-containing protein [Maritalea porphyrae]MCZ4270791.1 helix-turn-helix domain-containing protein [Maritalea porphyrae]
MSIIDRRLERGWTQEQLAEFTGLSARTVQRIEAGKPANLESLKCLAAVFETNVAELIEEQKMAMNTDTNPAPDSKTYYESEAIDYVKRLKELYKHAVVFIVVSPLLVLLNYFISPGIWWVIFAIAPWAFAVCMHFLAVFGFLKFLGPDWEQRQFQKRMRSHEVEESKSKMFKK